MSKQQQVKQIQQEFLKTINKLEHRRRDKIIKANDEFAEKSRKASNKANEKLINLLE